MCGIVGVIGHENVQLLTLAGLIRLEYRGYDSAGVAVLTPIGLEVRRAVGPLKALMEELEKNPMSGTAKVCIGHTRWATHGKPSVANAHPHMSGHIAIVHNGIIENHEELRAALTRRGYVFQSETDSEVIAHLIAESYTDSLVQAVRTATTKLKGQYAIVALSSREPEVMVATCAGSPLVVSAGCTEAHFVASDAFAFAPQGPEYRTFRSLNSGDVAVLSHEGVCIYDAHGVPASREVHTYPETTDTGLGTYTHYMEKEIAEQPAALRNTLLPHITEGVLDDDVFGPGSDLLFTRVRKVQIVACGTSHHAARVARGWFRSFGIDCDIAIASEYRYAPQVVGEGVLFLWISQSGETKDTAASAEHARTLPYIGVLGICNSDVSTLVRMSDYSFITRAGREQSVASTKAFTTQLAALRMLVLSIAKARGVLFDAYTEAQALYRLPTCAEQVLGSVRDRVYEIAKELRHATNVLFLARGVLYAVSHEGALKLTEVSYIHAQAFPGGELKHGPIALVDDRTPTIALVGNDLPEQMWSNIREIQARDGQVYAFVENGVAIPKQFYGKVLQLPPTPCTLREVLMVIPLQLLAYYVATLRGTNVDQPRNLAKSVTVE